MDVIGLPQDIPQDILWIRDIIGVPKFPPVVKLVNSDTINSVKLDSDIASEDEIQAELVDCEEGDEGFDQPTSSSDSDSSDTNSDMETSRKVAEPDPGLDDEEDDDELKPTTKARIHLQTKDDLLEGDVHVPDIQSVGSEEELEKAGEIAFVFGNVVIVKGLQSQIENHGSERALDSDTLLVFKDRSVMGYIYEIFGPTSQPFYQIKFSDAFPVDSERIKPLREVFYVPTRSIFVFLKDIRKFKGSDASNRNGEEPAECELDFSDDEAEAAFNCKMKQRKRMEKSRGRSMSSPQCPSSALPELLDNGMYDGGFYSSNPYDEHSPYDIGFNVFPARPAPIPYDDPYADYYLSEESKRTTQPVNLDFRGHRGVEGKDKGHNHRWQDSGRSRGRGRGERTARRRQHTGTQASWDTPSGSGWSNEASALRPPYKSRISRTFASTSTAIAQATEQIPDGSQYDGQVSLWNHSPSHTPGQSFCHEGLQGYPQMFIQPHINPRFVEALSMTAGLPQDEHPHRP